MTIQLVQQALLQGYSINKIIDWLVKNKSALGSSISEAMRQGYDTNQIEEYLMKSAGMPFSQRNKALPGMTEEEKARGIHYKGSKAQRNIGNILQTAAVAAPVAAASYTLSPMLMTALGRAAPQLMQTAAQRFPALAPLLGQTSQASPLGIPSATPPMQGAVQPQTQAPQTPATPALSTGAITGDILNSFLTSPMGELAQKVSETYQDVPTVSGIIRHFFDKDVRKFEKQTGSKLEDILTQVLAKTEKKIPAKESLGLNAPEAQTATGLERPISALPNLGKEINEEPAKGLAKSFEGIEESATKRPADKEWTAGEVQRELKVSYPEAARIAEERNALLAKGGEPEKIEKNSLVASPNGLGIVKEVRNGQALIDVGGKLHKASIEDLEQEPEEIKRAEIVIKPEEIPENLRSAALGFVSVPKSRRDVDIMFGPSGKFYRYYRKDGKPVPEDVIEKLREGQTLPISSGDTYMGAFDASIADSRGTIAYHDLKAKAQSKEAVEKGVMKKGRHVKEEDDPEKEFWYEELESPFIHGFIDKFLKVLTQRSREYQKAKKEKK